MLFNGSEVQGSGVQGFRGSGLQMNLGPCVIVGPATVPIPLIAGIFLS